MQANQLKPICNSLSTEIIGAAQKCNAELNSVITQCNDCFVKMDISTKQLESATEITEEITNTYKAALATCQQKTEIIELLGKELKNCDEVYNELTTVQEFLDFQSLKTDEELSDEAEALRQRLDNMTEY